MLLTVETAAQLEHMTPRSIYRWVEGAAVHFHETSEGAVFICSESLKGLGERDNEMSARRNQ
jgi:predicted flavoprotein YhiN